MVAILLRLQCILPADSSFLLALRFGQPTTTVNNDGISAAATVAAIVGAPVGGDITHKLHRQQQTHAQPLNNFDNAEAKRKIDLPPSLPDAQPFELLLFNICSLSWSDTLEAAGSMSHPLWFHFLILSSDNFNPATSQWPGGIRYRAPVAGGRSSVHHLYHLQITITSV